MDVPLPPLRCPIALAACWQKPHTLGVEGDLLQRQLQSCSVDQFDSCSIWDELAGKQQGFSKGQQNGLQFFS